MRLRIKSKLWRPIAYITLVIGIGAGAWFTRSSWLPLLNGDSEQDELAQDDSPPIEEAKVLKLSPQARANLGLSAKPVKVQSYWRKLQIPGVIVDRPGVTDRGITSPIAGVVTQVHAFEGDIIRPGEKLFTLKIVSESLQNLQSDLFKAIRETEIVNKEKQRVAELARTGIIPGKRILDLDQQLSRQSALIDAYRQDLLSRGLTQSQVEQVEFGKFMKEIEVHAPAIAEDITDNKHDVEQVSLTEVLDLNKLGFFEIQDLKVELGQQVDVGEALAVLANHGSLYISGHAFKKEASKLARAAENGWTVGVEFTEDTADDWPTLTQEFQIRHLANTTDPKSRTFDFFIPLTNESRVYEQDDRTFVIWRFRPGQRVRIQVPVEELHDVIVLPTGAVIREAAEAYVFHQNGDLCNRIPVQVIHEDSSNVVIADDANIMPGFYICQNSAASLNRILKAQAASGMRADVHVHADGTTHAAH